MERAIIIVFIIVASPLVPAELQRSVIFFSRANSSLKQQNDELSRTLIQTQCQVAAIEAGQQQQDKSQSAPAPGPTLTVAPPPPIPHSYTTMEQQAQAQAVATQAIFESQGFPPAAARAAAQTMNASPSPTDVQTGASMQAMANFQQAAAAAMQAAMGMNPVGVNHVAPIVPSYNEALNNFAMQQQGSPFAYYQSFMAQQPVVWQQMSQNGTLLQQPPQQQRADVEVDPNTAS
jgi:hypothetical protein